MAAHPHPGAATLEAIVRVRAHALRPRRAVIVHLPGAMSEMPGAMSEMPGAC